MSSVQSHSTSTSAQSSTGGSLPGKTTLVSGEGAPSVVVQSQLATSTVAGEGATRSNLGQVVGDLTAAHSAHSGWLESETQKISAWGTREIERLLAQTKGVEERLIAEAQTKQKLLEEAHKADLAKLVQELDAKKAMRLKELEDGLQRQIQAALDTSKRDINNIETEMNKRKMELMAQAQAQTAKEVDKLSSLAVEAKLVPSVTRTVIETNTETGRVLAVASGGQIATGTVSAIAVGGEQVRAVPTAGTLTQATDVTVGTLNRTGDNRVVGTGAIVDTQTKVDQRGAQPLAGSTGTGIGHTTHTTGTGIGHTTHTSGVPSAGVTSAAAPTVAQNINTTSVVGDKSKHSLDSAGRPASGTTSLAYKQGATADPYDKHAEGHHKESLLSKVKHAITGEPKSSHAHNSRV